MNFRKIVKLGSVFIGAALLTVGLSACSSKSSSTTDNLGLNQKGTLTIGLEGTYAPYSYRKDGKLTGFEVELGKALAKQMGLKAKFVPTKWDGLVAGLGSNKYDVVLNNITKTPERAKSYLFSKPYIYSRYVLITNKDKSNLNSLNDIKGQKFAEGTGTNNEQVAKKFGATIVPSGDFTTSIALIKQGRVAGTINAREAWLAYKKSNSTTGLKVKDVSSEQKAAQVVALFNKKSTKLQQKTNQALAKLRQNGTLTKLSKKYFNGDITK
ncbi:MAG: transporter substrate-binding domain-containing protein [Liquorilactobacillus nagelii]|jgi:cystine transport system substrate-binding protein|uniref:transporter substrate-binding domain-containing protein n=1 Tax=Liquorilactobacillus nagelii TaxID=82688 RepID=UPI0006F0675F|nr:transporter substrate-binding domain-containing protein [Liquorilactobacillus nagelii]KRL42129.1 high affinity cystine binding protein [Liquorilactobacillus nagelii DSM 13675]MCI1633870.1 transporter substrate-binding domain-containing protein [Liquorilactobacillus nagelii]QYH55100.1 transporter substrate-binding domain-containing protein [Liquorilactobacillus nagelii DSM 13675]